jgi:hypothetical protein
MCKVLSRIIITYHKSKDAGNSISVSMRGSPTVNMPVLILHKKFTPESVAMIITMRLFDIGTFPDSARRAVSGLELGARSANATELAWCNGGERLMKAEGSLAHKVSTSTAIIDDMFIDS